MVNYELSLSLFVLWFLADDTNNPLSADHDTLITDFFDGRTDFHTYEYLDGRIDFGREE